MQNNEKKYYVNESMTVLSVVYAVFLIVIAAVTLYIRRYVSSIIFLLISLPFFFLIYRYGSRVYINNEGVTLKFLNKERKRITWEETKEISVCGQRVLNHLNKKKCGTLYITLSTEKMNDDERFEMMLKWPPRDKIYFKFSKEALFNIQLHYTTPVEKYNIGMLDI